MGVFATDERQATLIYHPGSPSGEELAAYVRTSDKKIRIIDLSKENLTGTQWVEIAEGLKIKIHNLIDQEHPLFQETYGSSSMEMNEHDWIDVLSKNPEVLAKPVFIDGNEFHRLDKPSQFLNISGAGSAGIEKPYSNPQEK